MKLICALTFFLMLSVGMQATEPAVNKELTTLQTMITLTEQSLEAQKKVYTLVQKYQELQKQYMVHPDDDALLMQLIQAAHRAHLSITENHLTQAFDPSFMSELTLFAQAAAKQGIPRP